MATRVSGWTSPVGAPTTGAPPVVESHVTAGAIDAALAAVERDFGLSSEVAEGLRRLMSADHTSGVAHAYYGALAHRGHQTNQLRAVKKALVIPHSLTQEESDELAQYAPDFKLGFRNTDSHDHPVYAAQRMIDQVICESRVPPGCHAADLGGSLTHHATEGNLHWHVCSPLACQDLKQRADRKDMVRRALQRLRLRKMSTDANATAETREYASRCLAGDTKLVCGKRAQDCDYAADAAVSVHVYDIPMQDWPGIMEKKKLKLVEGCMLFSQALLENKTGVFPSAGVRYECDVEKDVYNMGFVDSPSWWYKHSLKDHLRYGVDQVLHGREGTYSYKIVERRADTIFFRILRVGGATKPDVRQVYKLPGVPMVSVTGPEISTKKLARRQISTWHWPEPLWTMMVSSALERLERGTFTVEEQFNRYRSIAPRQTINAVRVSGGFEAVIGDRVALVVYSTFEAVVLLAKQRLAFDTMAKHQYKARQKQQMSGLVNLISSLAGVACEGMKFVCKPLQALTKMLEIGDEDALLALYSSGPRVAYRVMPAELVLSPKWYSGAGFSADSGFTDFREQVRATVPADYMTAAASDTTVAGVLVDLFGDSMPKVVREKAAETAPSVAGSGLTGETVVQTTESTATEMEVRLSIQEAIAETELEAQNVEASCIKFRNECLLGGEPNRGMLVRKKEEMMQPDFWYINKGVIANSLLGREGSDFDLSGLLLPVQSASGSFIHPVLPVVYEGPSRGRQVVVEHATIADTSYTGWAFANTSLAVYNGPEIVAALQASMKVYRPVDVVLHFGPAGCGKTTEIVRVTEQNDVILCPAKASVLETRGRLTKSRTDMKFPVLMRCKTVDSYLVHVLSNPRVRALRTDVLRGDEAFMMRSGRWYACALLLGAKRIDAYGDPQQIPHVPRALCPALHLRLRPTSVDEKFVSYRCPHDAVAAVGDIYGWKVRSASKVSRSLAQLSGVDAEPVEPGCVMLCMYQDDKKVLSTMYARQTVPIRIMTVHEAQGNTFQHVRLHRFVRGKNQTNVPDAFDLFQKKEYVLVAMTRHTHSFRYYTQMGSDQVSARVVQGSSVSRINAAADLASAGKAVEFM
uniref:ORF1 n=1 Tax=Plasmopara viticola lesion associated vivivirus 2 TaxID=2770121 RepID=A0A7H0RR04_9VIRU|nr:ORF1 [Plasmopara viticola lesion associated vivivirus 2]